MTAPGSGWARALRWTARVWSFASIVLVVGFLVGEGFHPSGANEWLGSLCFPLGVCAGMIVAWRRDRLGGMITVASLLLFYGIHLITADAFPRGWAWLAFAAPGFLFALSALASRDRSARPA